MYLHSPITESGARYTCIYRRSACIESATWTSCSSYFLSCPSVVVLYRRIGLVIIIIRPHRMQSTRMWPIVTDEAWWSVCVCLCVC